MDTQGIKDFEGYGILVADFVDVHNIRIVVDNTGSRAVDFAVVASSDVSNIKHVDMLNVDEIFVCQTRRSTSEVKIFVDTTDAVEYRVSGTDADIEMHLPTDKKLVLKGKRLGTVRDFVVNTVVENGDLIVTIPKVDKPLSARIGVDGTITISRLKR